MPSSTSILIPNFKKNIEITNANLYKIQVGSLDGF